MIIDCVSDLHGYYPQLEGGDLLIVAGDLTASDKPYQYDDFQDWLSCRNYKKVIIVAGNHDNTLQNDANGFINYSKTFQIYSMEYLCDSGTEFGGLKIWGSPWTKTFGGMNPYCKAFTVNTEEELEEKFQKIPNDVDILITHSPPYGLCDKTITKKHAGSKSLGLKIAKIQPKLTVCGHIHEQGSKTIHCRYGGILINASHVNECYEPINKPIRVIL